MWLRGVSAHTPTRPHARTPPRTLSLSLFLPSVGAGAEAAGVSEAQTAPRMLGRGRRSRCGYPSPTCLDAGSSRSCFCWPFGVSGADANPTSSVGVFVAPYAAEKTRFPPPEDAGWAEKSLTVSPGIFFPQRYRSSWLWRRGDLGGCSKTPTGGVTEDKRGVSLIFFYPTSRLMVLMKLMRDCVVQVTAASLPAPLASQSHVCFITSNSIFADAYWAKPCKYRNSGAAAACLRSVLAGMSRVCPAFVWIGVATSYLRGSSLWSLHPTSAQTCVCVPAAEALVGVWCVFYGVWLHWKAGDAARHGVFRACVVMGPPGLDSHPWQACIR